MIAHSVYCMKMTIACLLNLIYYFYLNRKIQKSNVFPVSAYLP